MADRGVRLTWLGHSTVSVETAGVRLLTDPVLRTRVAHLRRQAGVPPGVGLPPDAVLVSHVHWDHLDLPSLRRLGTGIPLVVPRGAGRLLRRQGFAHVTELAPGERTQIGSVDVLATHAEHAARRRPWGARPASLGFLVEGPVRIYFAGDTDLFPGLSALAPVDAALLPIAGWGPRTGAGHLDARGAAAALALLEARVAIPIHWGTYARIGARRLAQQARAPAEEFVAHARELAPRTRVEVLSPGDNIIL